MNDRRRLTRYAWLSILTACVTISLKFAAYWLTGSVGLLSDALESVVNLVAALAALLALIIAALPPDQDHAYGHSKVEYFSSGLEGSLIIVAAITIAYSAIGRLLSPVPLEQVGIGLTVSVLAAMLNLFTARVLLRAGRQYRSVTLIADAHHLMTDVWTSGGVLLGVGAVAITGWIVLDPLLALLVALQIVRSGIRLLRESALGLMDTALPNNEQQEIIDILERHSQDGVTYHALRTRQAGAQRFVSVHVQVPGAWTVQAGHSLVEEIEREVRQVMAPVSILTHLEPVEDPVSWEDVELNRPV